MKLLDKMSVWSRRFVRQGSTSRYIPRLPAMRKGSALAKEVPSVPDAFFSCALGLVSGADGRNSKV
jgi:hypothetical protein